MCESFKRSEEFLDIEVKEEDPLLKHKEQIHMMIENSTPDNVQQMLQLLGIGNT